MHRAFVAVPKTVMWCDSNHNLQNKPLLMMYK